jgi:hypothetical protein
MLMLLLFKRRSLARKAVSYAVFAAPDPHDVWLSSSPSFREVSGNTLTTELDRHQVSQASGI